MIDPCTMEALFRLLELLENCQGTQYCDTIQAVIYSYTETEAP